MTRLSPSRFITVCTLAVALLLMAAPALADDVAAIPDSADERARIVTYRGFDDAFTVELRPTGHPTAPFVGILRYNEQVFSCNGVDASKCSVASSLPVTEIFRYQGGRWIY